MLPLYSNSVDWTFFPIPYHNGILLSSAVSKYFSINQLKDKLMRLNLEKGFDKILPDVEMKLIDLIDNDSLWLIKWNKDNCTFIAVSFGSEL